MQEKMEQPSIWRPDWTAEEIQVVVELFCGATREEILNKLPSRNWCGVCHQAKRLKIRRLRITRLEDLSPLNLSEVEKTWLACAIDSEGCVGLCSSPQKRINHPNVRTYKPYINMTNTHLEFMQRFKQLLYSDLKILKHVHPSTNQKDSYIYSIFSMPKIYAVLKDLLPYFIIKKKQAELVLKWIELEDERMGKTYFGDPLQYSAEQKEIWKALMALNQRGKNFNNVISIVHFQRANEFFKKNPK